MREIVESIEKEFKHNTVYKNCDKILIYVMIAQNKKEIKHSITEYIIGNKIIVCNYKKDKFIILDNGYYDIELGMIEIFNEHNKISKLLSLRYFKRLPKIIYNIIDVVESIWDQMWFQPHFTLSCILCIVMIILMHRNEELIIETACKIIDKLEKILMTY